ncbi:MAG TPA: helix-turn-helix transcriptional regulator [Methylophilus sp.]|uniref:helix-turn-helix domain-containing protein n=1 Tax=Methylophilus sp. TaxID=29541 RepID=UPI002BE64DEB|nr:helix-turn-helix transcriptional regulator [Methylophilus sp.]HSH86869.1 helix-turn-helix transcriptional regulator [Methylophilus sp.]
MNNFQRIRLMLQLSQQEIADKLGISQPNVSKIESGQEVSPDIARNLIAIAKEKGVTLTFDDVYAPIESLNDKAA